MDNQPMREMSLIELINSLPETHIARKEYIKFLGRLSKEKNERLHFEQEVKELNEDLIETQKQASKVESELEVFQSFFVDKDHCYELEDKTLTEWIAEHDKQVAVKAIEGFIKNLDDKHFAGLPIQYANEYIEQLKQEQE